MVNAGDLRDRVALQENRPKRNDAGGLVECWVTVAQVWAEVKPFVASERHVSAADQEIAKSVQQVMIRYRPDVSVKWRVIWQQLIFDITSIEDRSGRREMLALVCEAVLP